MTDGVPNLQHCNLQCVWRSIQVPSHHGSNTAGAAGSHKGGKLQHLHSKAYAAWHSGGGGGGGERGEAE